MYEIFGSFLENPDKIFRKFSGYSEDIEKFPTQFGILTTKFNKI